MKQPRERSCMLALIVVCGAVTLVACGDDSSDADGESGGAGGATPAGASGNASGSPSLGGKTGAGGGGASAAAGSASEGGTDGGVSGSSSASGSSNVSGSSGRGGSSNAGGRNSGGTSTGGTNSGGSSTGGVDTGGNSPLGPFGIVSCQPRFEQACKPPVVFTNGDPTGRGKVFTDAVPDVIAAEQEIACTACSILYRDPSEIPANKRPKRIEIVLDDYGGVAQAGGDRIQFDLDYIASYAGRPADEIKREMLGVLQHETVHLYQNYGNAGTGEGLADLVRARTGYYPKSRFAKGEGTWRDAYTASGNFYSWLTGPCSYHAAFYPSHDLDLPYKLNHALAGKSGDGAYDAVEKLLETTFGEGPDALWEEYQRTAF